MGLALQVIQVAALLVLVGFLIPLVLQLKRSARGFDEALGALREDFAKIAEDAHQTRLRVDALAADLQPSLAALAEITRDAREAADRMRRLAAAFEHHFASTAQWVGALLGGLDAVLAFLKARTQPHGDSPGSPP